MDQWRTNQFLYLAKDDPMARLAQGQYTHVSITGHVEEMREDTDLADIDRLAQQYIGKPYPQRDRRRISVWIAADGWPVLAVAHFFPWFNRSC